MNQPIDSLELQALLDLQDTQKETASTIMAQIVEVQATLQVMIDLQKLTITGGVSGLNKLSLIPIAKP